MVKRIRLLLQHGRLRASEAMPIIPRVTRLHGQACKTLCIYPESQSLPRYGRCRIPRVSGCTAFIFPTVKASELIRMLNSGSTA